MVTQEKATLTVAELARYLGMSENHVYAGLESHQIPARQVGRKWVISKLVIDEWLRGERK